MPPVASAEADLPEQKPSFFERLKSAGSDDKRLVRLLLLVGFGVLLILGITAAVLEQVAPRGGGVKTESEVLFSSQLWQIQPLPNQIIFGFYLDNNSNNQFDYQESPFDKVSVAIRRLGETEPFRRVAAGSDGLVKIDDLAQGEYEISLDNYSLPDSEAGEWLWFDQYQQNTEFLPTVWRGVSLAGQGYKELIGLIAYQPPLLLALVSDAGISWYDPLRARVYAKSNQPLTSDVFIHGHNVYYIKEGNLQKLDWSNRAVTEELIWLEEAEAGGWWLSPGGKTVAYKVGKELIYRSQVEDCREGGLLWDGLRLEVKAISFIDEISWLVIGRGDQEAPWQVFKVDCGNVEPVETAAEPVSVGVLGGGDWFFGTAEAVYLVDNAKQQRVKYSALGNGQNISVSDDKRYLLKSLGQNSWLVVDYPAVKTSGVEKHYLLTGIAGEPTLIGDDVYFVRAKPCEADGDCGEVVRIKLGGSGVWSIESTWDLKDVAATKVLGVVD